MPVKEPPKNDSSISDMFIFERVDMYCSTVLCMSDGFRGSEWAVILRWLQKTHSLLHPLWGMKMGIMAWFFISLDLFLYDGADVGKAVILEIHYFKTPALDKIAYPGIVAVPGDIAVENDGAAHFSGSST